MTLEAAFHAAGVPAAVAAREALLASAAMREHGITSQRRAEYFLAQVLHESGGLRWFEELADGSAYEGRRDVGNVHPGDGRRYKGRGPIQLTGRANYRWAGAELGLPLEAHPELASHHEVGWRIAALYWKAHDLNRIADAGDFLLATRRINGGTNGLDDRRRYLELVSRVDCRPRKPDPYAALSNGERVKVKRYDELLRAKRAGRDTPGHRAERVRLRAAMTRSRKAIHHVAQPRTRGGDGRGWTHAHRRERYRMLLARTR